MHELAICQALISQVEEIAKQNHAISVSSITLGLGQLSGVEEDLLRHAYPVAKAGTLAENAELIIQSIPLRVHCSRCQAESDASPNQLICASCGDWRTDLVAGDELLLLRMELDKDEVKSEIMPATVE